MLLPVVLFASFALIQQAPANAPTVPAAATGAAAVPATNATRPVAETTQVCRTEAVTGSRFGRRVCRSSVETAEERRNSQEMLRRMQGARMPDG